VQDPPGQDRGRRPDDLLLSELPAPAGRYDGRVTRTRKLGLTAILFSAAVALLAVSVGTKSAGPLFAMWVPLLAVPWVLVRPEPGDQSE
jgi:hypothetical protein